MGEIQHILLITQEVVNKFLGNFLRGEMSHWPQAIRFWC